MPKANMQMDLLGILAIKPVLCLQYSLHNAFVCAISIDIVIKQISKTEAEIGSDFVSFLHRKRGITQILKKNCTVGCF
jgi:hypothetical protein